jgi:type I restriction enzyme S subunit
MKLVPYPKYKDAGVSWVGSIPAHWPEKRAKYYFKEIDERSRTGDEEMLSVSHITGVTPRSQKNVTMFKAESNVGQKRCQPGDLIINTMWAWMSALGVSNHAGIVSPAYGVYRPRSNQDYDDYYLDSLVRIEGYRSEYICRSTGIRSSRLRLYPDKFLSMPVVCPPQEEQQAIARFLKAQDCLFRKFIRNKRRLIELLKEQKQNIINQAVTRGCDPNVKFKPSGVEWIGDIPEHWSTRKIKHLARFFSGGTPSKSVESFWRGTIPWVSPKDMKTDRIFDAEDHITDEAVANSATSIVNIGTLLLVVRSGILRRTIPIALVERPVSFNQDIKAVLPDTTFILPEYLQAIIVGCENRLLEKWSKVGATVESIEHEFFANTYLPLPPIDEQLEILEHIQEKSTEIDQVITRAQHEIELMHEYRTRLISDVVTGQVDVRGIDVPEVADEELLALEESAADADDDDVIDDEGDMDETD